MTKIKKAQTVAKSPQVRWAKSLQDASRKSQFARFRGLPPRPVLGNPFRTITVELSRNDLLPNYLSQRLIDPVLPARSSFLKVIKNVPVNSQRDKLLGIRDSWTLRRELRGFGGCRLERRFSRIP
jgi:hypothetical protein